MNLEIIILNKFKIKLSKILQVKDDYQQLL